MEFTTEEKAARWDAICDAWMTYCTEGCNEFDWDYDSRDLMRSLVWPPFDVSFVGGPKHGHTLTLSGDMPRELHVPMYTDDDRFNHPTTARDARSVRGIYRPGDGRTFVWTGEWDG